MAIAAQKQTAKDRLLGRHKYISAQLLIATRILNSILTEESILG